ncbi:MAG: MBL fold metallo-hydrolase, partial [Caulobacteraceae bacterium]
VQPFRLGAFRLTALRDAQHIVDNDGKVFGLDAGPAAVAGVLKAAGAPADRITLGVDALLVRMPGHVALLDSGYGAGVHGALQQSVAMAGVSPAEVTDVLMTHSHPDHVGGLATPDGRPAFPSAVIRMSSAEWAFMQAQGRTKALAAIIAPQVRTFQPGQMVLPGITAIGIPGHTPGHVGYEIVSAGQRLIDIGDSAHSSIVSLAKPDWSVGFDNDRDLGRTRRREILARLAKSREWVFSPHFPFPGVGHIVSSGDHYIWKPGLP